MTMFNNYNMALVSVIFHTYLFALINEILKYFIVNVMITDELVDINGID